MRGGEEDRVSGGEGYRVRGGREDRVKGREGYSVS